MNYKEIEGYPNYEVSQTGYVRNKKFERDLKLTLNNEGYLEVQLHRAGIGKTTSVHRIVALTFIPNPELKPMVNHIDGDRTNNHISNLEWCTNQENITHSKMRNGGIKISKKRIMRIYKSKQWESVEDFLIEIMKH